ncbi:hypothetical protein DUNSADRAFT_5645, partial [Dunaliella salina]
MQLQKPALIVLGERHSSQTTSWNPMQLATQHTLTSHPPPPAHGESEGDEDEAMEEEQPVQGPELPPWYAAQQNLDEQVCLRIWRG